MSTGERALAIGLALLASFVVAPEAGAVLVQPNIVVVMTDDQRLWDMEAMPKTNRLLGEAGTTFENNFATYPLCCPSRSTFLSGQYAHNHGVTDNDAPEGGYAKFDFSNALAVWLQQAGYRTAHIGKMLNEYGSILGPPHAQIAPGYDDWFALRDPTTYLMYDYIVQDNALRRPFGVMPEDYQTDVLANRTIADIRQWAPSDQPFFIQLATSAVHWEFIDAENGPRPAPRHEGSFADHEFHPRPNYDEEDVSDKPSVIRHYARIDSGLEAKIAESHRTRLEALQAVDEAVARIVDELEQAGELDNTLIVFTSDNGYLHGEHRFPSEKVVPYEESVRVPLLIRGPGFPAGVSRSQLVGNIDLAPTIAELAGATAGRVMDGESLVPFAQEPDHRPDRSILFEADFDEVEGQHAVVVPAYHEGVNVFYDAIRSERFKYVHWFRDVDGNPVFEEELYDLEADPYEMQSLHESPRHAAVKRELAGQLDGFKDCVGAACRQVTEEPALPCLRGPQRVRRRAIGSARLGAPGAELLTQAGSPKRVVKRRWTYCARPNGSTHAVLSKADRVRLVATTAATRGARGVRRRTRIARVLRAYPGAESLTPKLIAARGGLVFGIRRGRVRFVAIADRELRRDERALARNLRRLGL
ncbi:MAG: sulfatase family protein [Solirubrobacterales bacterium]